MGMATLASSGAAVVPSSLSDAEIVRRVRTGDRALFEILMRRHNQRVYRATRAGAISARIGAAEPGAFQFEAPRCDRVVAAVFARIPDQPDL
jgi:hypothetical protein